MPAPGQARNHPVCPDSERYPDFAGWCKPKAAFFIPQENISKASGGFTCVLFLTCTQVPAGTRKGEDAGRPRNGFPAKMQLFS